MRQTAGDHGLLPAPPGRPRQLVPAALRPAAIAALAACVVLVTALAVWFAHRTTASWLDQAVDPWLRASIGRHPAAPEAVAWLGEGLPVTAMTIALAGASLAARRWRGAALAAIAVPAAAGMTELLLKPLVSRTLQAAIPFAGYTGGQRTFPSGHATAAFALATTVAVLLASPAWPRISPRLRQALTVAAFVVAAAVSVAVTALGYHYFTDTIGGAAVGTGTVLATALIIDRLITSRLITGRLMTGGQGSGTSRPSLASRISPPKWRPASDREASRSLPGQK